MPKEQYCVLQSWSAPGQTPWQAQTQQKAGSQQKAEAEQWVQEGPSKEDVKAADQAVEKATAPTAPVSQEIKGLLGLAYPDLMAVATTACDAWTKGQTQVYVLSIMVRRIHIAYAETHADILTAVLLSSYIGSVVYNLTLDECARMKMQF